MKNIKELAKIVKDHSVSEIDILVSYCKHENIQVGYLLNVDNDPFYKKHRKIIAWIVKKSCGHSLESISALLNRANHSSASEYIKSVNKELSFNEGFKSNLEKAISKLCEEFTA